MAALAWAGSAPAQPAAVPTSGDESRQVLDQYLAAIPGASQGRVAPVTAPAIARALPRPHLFLLRFPQWPVARMPPRPLKSNNLFAVAGGQVTPIDDAAGLAALMRDSVAGLESRGAVDDAATAGLLLWIDLNQDGFFRFQEPEVKISGSGGAWKVHASVRVVAERGDKGELDLAMTVDGGKLVEVAPSGKLLAGVRPICQARKLLDPDPVVRRMAQRDILVMGSAAREYLQQQRAEADQPLQDAIDRIWQQIVEEGR